MVVVAEWDINFDIGRKKLQSVGRILSIPAGSRGEKI